MITATLLDSWLTTSSDPAPTTPITTLPGSTTVSGSTTVPASSNATIAAWGDSLTEGGLGNATPYPTLLATLLGRTVRNFGIAGQKAESITARQGGLKPTLSVQGNAFAGTGPVTVTALSVKLLYTTGNDTRTITGVVAGVPCTMTRTATGTVDTQVETYTLTPKSASTASVPANSEFIPDDGVANKGAVQILWMGRNDVPALTNVGSLIDSAVNYLDQPARFLLIGVPPSLVEPKGSANFKAIDSFNAGLAAKYPNQYISITPPTDAEMTAIGYTPSAQDKADIANGLFPVGMHTNDVHFKTEGYQVVVNRLAAKLKAMNW